MSGKRAAETVSISHRGAQSAAQAEDPAELRRLGLAIQRGDAQAFDRLIDVFGTSLLQYLQVCVRHRETAEDLLQDTLVAAVRHHRRLRHPERLRPWLFRIARHTALNWQRRRRRRPDMTAQPLEDLTPGPVVNDRARDRAQRRDLRRILDGALATLPNAEREVVILRHYQHLSCDEIAQVLGVRVGTVHSRTHRALKRLAKALRVLGHTPETLL